MSTEFQQHADELIDAGRLLFSMGMVPATHSAFTARSVPGMKLITTYGNSFPVSLFRAYTQRRKLAEYFALEIPYLNNYSI